MHGFIIIPRCLPIRLSSAANGNDVDAQGDDSIKQNVPRSLPRGEKEGVEKQSVMRGTPQGGERNNETSRFALETGEKKSETCV